MEKKHLPFLSIPFIPGGKPWGGYNLLCWRLLPLSSKESKRSNAKKKFYESFLTYSYTYEYVNLILTKIDSCFYPIRIWTTPLKNLLKFRLWYILFVYMFFESFVDTLSDVKNKNLMVYVSKFCPCRFFFNPPLVSIY